MCEINREVIDFNKELFNEIYKSGNFSKVLKSYDLDMKNDLLIVKRICVLAIERDIDKKLDYDGCHDLIEKYAKFQKSKKDKKIELFPRFNENENSLDIEEIRKFKGDNLSITYRDFSNTLRSNLRKSKNYPQFIDYGPDLFQLLCEILCYDIPRELRLAVNSAIAYFVAPIDYLSEEEFGAYGYIDDIFLSIFVIRMAADELGYDFLQKLWPTEEDIEHVLISCYAETLDILNEEDINQILSYAGLI